MRKTEIEKAVKSLYDAIQNFRNDLRDILKPYRIIEDKLDELYDMQDYYMIDTGIDFRGAKADAFACVIEENEEWLEIDNKFNALIDDLEVWEDRVSEKNQEKAGEIREVYIEQLENIRTELCLDDINDEDSLDDMLIGIQNTLEEFEYA